MARRFIQSVSNKADTRTAKVYRDSDTKEYVVRLYARGELYRNADYYTDDKEDALGTAARMVDEE